MFDTAEVLTAFANLLGWRDHYDLTEIPALPASLTTSETGEFYQQKHPALRLDIVQALIPDNYPLDVYLRNQINDSIVEMLNDLVNYRQVGEYGKTLLKETQLLNKYGWLNDQIVNNNRFVGWQIRVRTAEGLKAMINQIGLQFRGAESFDLYWFYSGQNAPLQQIAVTTTGTAQWDWVASDLVLESFTNDQIQGGVFILGYYQEDLVLPAINMTNFNWDRGACGSCNKSQFRYWTNVMEYFTIQPLYVPAGNYVKGEMFDLQDAIYVSDQSYGLNLRLSVHCDLTDFWIRNKFSFANLLGLKVALKIMNQMKFSQQINYIEENIKMMIIRDLEGDMETRMTPLAQKYHKELHAVAWNTSALNEKCLPCTDKGYAPIYDVV